MAEFSFCQVTIKLSDANKLARDFDDSRARFFAQFDLEYSTSNIGGDVGKLYETFDFDEARYGVEELADMLAWFKANGVEYNVVDHGSYDWSAYEAGWRIGMGAGHWRNLDDDGVPQLTIHQWLVLSERTVNLQSLMAFIDGHFGDDPQHWLGGQR